jgi:geranylgeranyl diphosphate synthase, type I
VDVARAELATFLAARRAEIAALDPRLLPDVDRLLDFTGTGKWLRPQFLLAGHLAAGVTGEVPAEICAAAAALELVQACALLHDDVMDRSDTRRGLPSTHRAIAAAHDADGWSGDSDHYGESVAILLGDLALAWADDLFTESATRLGRLIPALPAWRGMRTEVLAGQLLDLRAAADSGETPGEQVQQALAVNRWKTAAYTVERPLHLGAVLGGASPAVVDALRRYGAAIGVAFQLRDDLLGVFGDPSVTGKPAGNDLVEGKRTVLLAVARSALDPTDARLHRLDDRVGRPMDAATASELAELIAGTGAPQQVEQRIDDLVGTAHAALDTADAAGTRVLPDDAVDLLRRLGDRAVRRSS